MTELAEFLLARIAEDERIARTITAHGRWDWREFPAGTLSLGDDNVWAPYFSIDVSKGVVFPTASVIGHIARWDPARVLAECESKRRIVEELLATRHEVVDGDCWFTCAAATEDRDGGECCDDSRRGTGCDCGRDRRVETYLRLLALPYADHPDFQPEWSPQVAV